jgi:hypothetical protein
LEVLEMGCWRLFSGLQSEAGLEVTDENREKIDDVIHKFIGEQSNYGRCSADWKKARKEIKADEEMKQELFEKLRKIS